MPVSKVPPDETGSQSGCCRKEEVVDVRDLWDGGSLNDAEGSAGRLNPAVSSTT